MRLNVVPIGNFGYAHYIPVTVSRFLISRFMISVKDTIPRSLSNGGNIQTCNRRWLKVQKIIFVADKFVDEYIGGAELSTDALMHNDIEGDCIDRIKSKAVTPEYIIDNEDAYWIITNFADLSDDAKCVFVSNGHYSIVEYDFKICQYRCPEWHAYITGKPCECVCHKDFYQYADVVFFMSQKQKEYYDERISGINGVVLSSIFHSETLKQIRQMDRTKTLDLHIVAYSPSYVKGTRETVKHCIENGVPYQLVCNLTYEEMLKTFARSKGYAYLPAGMDTCPRAVIEAKLLGCDLILNDNVLHKDEYWFNQKNDMIFAYLETRTGYFWIKVHEQIENMVENCRA